MYVGTKATSPNETFEVAVIVDGVEQPLYRRASDGKLFVVAEPSKPYQLRVRNLLDNRLEVITSVDGRNTQKDEKADKTKSVGTTVNAYEILTITGWRLNDSQTGQFRFNEPQRSIAGQLAEPDLANVGVIGFAVNREANRSRRMYYDPAFGSAVAPNAYSEPLKRGFTTEEPTKDGSVGTGIGATLHDPARKPSYEPPVVRSQGTPAEVVAIGYDRREILEEMGLLVPAEPNPFPGITTDTGYAAYRRS
jgi:hypothetical protein